MKRILLFSFVALSLFSCKDSANSDRPSSKYEGTKAQMADMEKDSPTKFLKVSGSSRNNLVNRTVVEGEVSNKSSLTTYKNIEVQLNFKDKEGKSLEKQKHTLEEVVKPGESADFKIKVKHVKDAESVTIDIVGADADK